MNDFRFQLPAAVDFIPTQNICFSISRQWLPLREGDFPILLRIRHGIWLAQSWVHIKTNKEPDVIYLNMVA